MKFWFQKGSTQHDYGKYPPNTMFLIIAACHLGAYVMLYTLNN